MPIDLDTPVITLRGVLAATLFWVLTRAINAVVLRRLPTGNARPSGEVSDRPWRTTVDLMGSRAGEPDRRRVPVAPGGSRRPATVPTAVLHPGECAAIVLVHISPSVARVWCEHPALDARAYGLSVDRLAGGDTLPEPGTWVALTLDARDPRRVATARRLDDTPRSPP